MGNESVAVCKRLLTSPNIDVDIMNNDRWRAIHYACLHHDLEIIKLLTTAPYNANLKSTNIDGQNPLHCIVDPDSATMSPQGLECIRYLLGCDKGLAHQADDRQLRPFQTAIVAAKDEAALLLMAEATEEELMAPALSFNSLAMAAGRGLVNVVKELLRRGADPNDPCGEDGYITPLQMACQYERRNVDIGCDYVAVVKLLCANTNLRALMDCSKKEGSSNPFAVSIDWECWTHLTSLCDHYPVDALNHKLPSNLLLLADETGTTSSWVYETPLAYFLRTCDLTDNRCIHIVETFIRAGSSLNGGPTEDQIPCLLAFALSEADNIAVAVAKGILEALVSQGANLAAIDTFMLSLMSQPQILILLIQRGAVQPEYLLTRSLLRAIDRDGHPPELRLRCFTTLMISYVCIGHHSLLSEIKEALHLPTSLKVGQVLEKQMKKTCSLAFLARKAVRQTVLSSGSASSPTSASFLVQQSKTFAALPIVLQKFLCFSEVDASVLVDVYIASRECSSL